MNDVRLWTGTDGSMLKRDTVAADPSRSRPARHERSRHPHARSIWVPDAGNMPNWHTPEPLIATITERAPDPSGTWVKRIGPQPHRGV